MGSRAFGLQGFGNGVEQQAVQIRFDFPQRFVRVLLDRHFLLFQILDLDVKLGDRLPKIRVDSLGL